MPVSPEHTQILRAAAVATMSDAVPVAEAMEEAQAVLTINLPVEPNDTASDDGPVQVPLFEPPPFDFEEAYDELHRLDRRAQNRKSAWESLKGAASDAKKDYDSAIDDLHDKFDEIDSARRVAAAVRQGSKPAQEEVKPQMPGLDETIDEPTPPETPPTEPEPDEGDETPVE